MAAPATPANSPNRGLEIKFMVVSADSSQFFFCQTM
jgi:hypothetical protein